MAGPEKNLLRSNTIKPIEKGDPAFAALAPAPAPTPAPAPAGGKPQYLSESWLAQQKADQDAYDAEIDKLKNEYKSSKARYKAGVPEADTKVRLLPFESTLPPNEADSSYETSRGRAGQGGGSRKRNSRNRKTRKRKSRNRKIRKGKSRKGKSRKGKSRKRR